MAFMCAAPQRARMAWISSYSACQFCLSTWARVMTMSISPAPSCTAQSISARRSRSGVRPEGNPAATEATGMPEPSSARTAAGTMLGYTQTAPTRGGAASRPRPATRSWRSGLRAFAHRRGPPRRGAAPPRRGGAGAGVEEGDGVDEPGGLSLLLQRTAGLQGFDAALRGRCVHLRMLEQGCIECDARVAEVGGRHGLGSV